MSIPFNSVLTGGKISSKCRRIRTSPLWMKMHATFYRRQNHFTTSALTTPCMYRFSCAPYIWATTDPIVTMEKFILPWYFCINHSSITSHVLRDRFNNIHNGQCSLSVNYMHWKIGISCDSQRCYGQPVFIVTFIKRIWYQWFWTWMIKAIAYWFNKTQSRTNKLQSSTKGKYRLVRHHYYCVICKHL